MRLVYLVLGQYDTGVVLDSNGDDLFRFKQEPRGNRQSKDPYLSNFLLAGMQKNFVQLWMNISRDFISDGIRRD